MALTVIPYCAELLRCRACEAEESGLRGRVVGAAERTDHPPGGGRDVDDAAVVLLLHHRQHRLHQEKGRRQVDLHGLPPFLGGDLFETGRQRQGGVVDQDVDSAEPVERLTDDCLGDSRHRDVARYREHTFTDLTRGCRRALRAAHVDGHQSAALIQPGRRGAPQPAGRAGDDGHAAGEVSRGIVGQGRSARILGRRWPRCRGTILPYGARPSARSSTRAASAPCKR